MVVEFTGRQAEVAPAVRAVAERKIGKLAKVLQGITHVRVVLSADRHLHRAEASVHSPHLDLAAMEEATDASAAVASAIEKLERQAKDHLGRLRERRDPAAPEA
jgi:putative sigma-54 modulation protein